MPRIGLVELGIVCAADQRHPGPGEMRTGGYSVIDAAVESAPIAIGRWNAVLRAGVQNLFNRSYRVWGSDFTAFGYALNIFGAPRTFGLQLTYNWQQG